MKYSKFIESDKFKNFIEKIDILPVNINGDYEYLDKLKELFDIYEKEILKVDFNDIGITIQVDGVKEICHIIIKSIEKQLSGNAIEAINTVEKLFKENDIGENLFTCILKPDDSSEFTKQLYRGRVGDEIYDLSDIFHVPFNKRQYVSTERYSIPGYPCLYLSGSVYGCWLELNKPNINNFYISRYEVKKQIKLLDLSLLPRDVINGKLGNGNECIIEADDAKKELTSMPEIIKKYIYTWPIICASSFVINEKNRVFKSEYIFPQLLLQVIKNFSQSTGVVPFDGIKYFSTKCKYGKNVRPDPVCVNYILLSDDRETFTNKSKDKYSLELSRKFKWTPPANAYLCSFLDQFNDFILKEQMDIMKEKLIDINNDEFRGKACIEIVKGQPILYKGSVFYNLEKILCKIFARDMESKNNTSLI